MTPKLKVVLAGRSERALRPLAQVLAAESNLSCSVHVLQDGEALAVSSIQPPPDVLVLRLDGDALPEFAAEMPGESRPPMIVVGPAGNPDVVRLAVRSGARDFLPEPLDPAALIAALQALREGPLHVTAGSHRAHVIAVIGAAGGVGTSLIACNLALALETQAKAPTLLLDLDVNFAPCASFLDLSPERGVPAALAEVADLDDQALPGYVAKHHSGLRLMGTPARQLVTARTLDPDRFLALMGVLTTNFRYVVVDVSHRLDDLSLAVLGMSRSVVLVLQQSVVQVKQAARLLGTLHNEVGLPRDSVVVVVNRHQARSTVGLDDIRHALGHEQLTVLPTDYKNAVASIDGGMPLLESDPSSRLSKGIRELQRELCGGPHVERHGLLHRALPIFSGD